MSRAKKPAMSEREAAAARWESVDLAEIAVSDIMVHRKNIAALDAGLPPRELVRAALEGDVPPVIVGTSTNNQAVTNIIDSFGSVKVPKGKGSCLNHRWLLDASSLEKGRGVPLQSLGTYFPAKGAKADRARIRAMSRVVDMRFLRLTACGFARTATR